jgi:hypothetical protein
MKQKRPELWYIDSAKAKVILFAAKSCELIIFFGGLWITLVVLNPEAATWVNGVIHRFFLTTLAFAIDAAFPESWIHAILQKAQGQRTQFKWSVGIAIFMTFLVIFNIIAIVVKGLPGWIDPVLIVTRMGIGFGYVAIRETQGALSRREMSDAVQLPPSVSFDSWQLTGLAAWLTQQWQTGLNALRAEMNQQLGQLAQSADLQELAETQQVNLVDLQVQRLFAEVQEVQECAEPEIDYQQLAVALAPLFQQRMEASVSAIKTTIIEEVRATLPVALEPPQMEVRATAQSHPKRGSRATRNVASEPESRSNGEPEERLQAAYELLLQNSIRVSGRVLAKEAHVNRSFAQKWLSERAESLALEPLIVVDSEPEA